VEEDVAHLRAAIEQLVVDPAARRQSLDLLSRIERSSKRAVFSADRTRKEMEVQFRLLSRTTDDLRKALAETEERVRERTRQLEAARDQLAELNRTLEERVAEQVGQLDRLGRLKRFFSPQVSDLILAGNAEDPLKSHRREITVVFVDLRGFTAFAETAEPEEVMGVLHEYHAAMGEVILAHEGTLERFTGDGMMIFFNDPVPVPNPHERAVRMAIEMRERVIGLLERWRKRGFTLDFGVGIAHGYATIGAIGFEGRWDYGAIGTVTNLAARLCGEAAPGQILISRRLFGLVEDLVDAEPVGDLMLKGFARPVPTFSVRVLRESDGGSGRKPAGQG
jgi:class 3 adenylate cyclase